MLVRTMKVPTCIYNYAVYSASNNLFTKELPKTRQIILISYINVWLFSARKFEEQRKIVPSSFVLAMYICAKVVNNDVPCLLAHFHNQGYVYSYLYHNILLFLKNVKIFVTFPIFDVYIYFIILTQVQALEHWRKRLILSQ